MYIETIPNRGSPPAVLLREARRQGKKIVKRTLANLSHWPAEQIETFRRLLRGDRLVPADPPSADSASSGRCRMVRSRPSCG